MDLGKSPIVFAPEKAATTGFQRKTGCSALLAMSKETAWRCPKLPLTRQKQHIGKDWSVNFVDESRGRFESTGPKICPRKNFAL
jgi:hypothetical protein